MKKLMLIFIFAFTFFSTGANAADNKKPEHLLDGSSMNYYYQTGNGIHMEFYDGMLKYEWITGSRKGNSNKDLAYQSRKIGPKMYIVSWLEEAHPDYVTLIFNFDSGVMYSSGIARFGSKNQFIVFDGGIIEDLKLIEK
ncbi:MoaF-related domain-containing protein [Colwellia sp. RE-S-Sl-9]